MSVFFPFVVLFKQNHSLFVVCGLVSLAPVAALPVLLVVRSAIPTTKRDKSTLSQTHTTHLLP